MTQVAAVLWDLDGTLIDSEPAWLAAARAVAAEHRQELGDAALQGLVGLTARAMGEVLADAGVPLDPEVCARELSARVAAEHTSGVTWRPGARELLHDLAAAGVPQALVTMSGPGLVAPVLDVLPAKTFAVVVTVDDVARPKPAPDAYVLAADRLGVDVARCVAVDDSAPGVAAAVASGAATVAVPLHTPVAAAGAAALWPDLTGRGLADIAALLDPSPVPSTAPRAVPTEV